MRTKAVIGWVVAGQLAGLSVPICADNNWLVRGRLLRVAPNDSSGPVSTLPGSGVEVEGDTTIELDFTYLFTRNLGVELILGTSKHTLKGDGTIRALGKIGEARTLPPVVSLQYHFAPDAPDFRPYIGIGVNYTRFYDESVTASLEAALGPTKLDIDSSTGLVGQVGVDIPIGPRWFVNLDAKYVVIETEATLRSGGVRRTVDIDLNPWFLGFGIGTRF